MNGLRCIQLNTNKCIPEQAHQILWINICWKYFHVNRNDNTTINDTDKDVYGKSYSLIDKSQLHLPFQNHWNACNIARNQFDRQNKYCRYQDRRKAKNAQTFTQWCFVEVGCVTVTLAVCKQSCMKSHSKFHMKSHGILHEISHGMPQDVLHPMLQSDWLAPLSLFQIPTNHCIVK